MPIRFKIGYKPPRFDGDRPTANATVSGPAELFTKELEKFLFLHGLNGVSADDYIVWSSRYTTAAPPAYLGPLLAKKFHVVPHKDLSHPLAEATSAYGEAHSFVPRGAGNAALAVDFGSGTFIANCSSENYARRAFLDGAGFRPLPSPPDAVVARFGDRPYIARDPIVAACLEPYMSGRARKASGSLFTEAMANIKRSGRLEAPDDFSVPVPDGLDYLDFQKVSIDHVSRTGRSTLIADDMGLGKTVQGIGIINGTPGATQILVGCKANMRLKWVHEINKWKVNPLISVGHAEGDHWPDTDVVVINYDIADRHKANIHARKWDIVITDEGQDLTNVEAKRTRAIFGDIGGTPDDADPSEMVPLADNGKLIILTGTPKPNKVVGLFPLLSAVDPATWGRGAAARQAFIDRYQPSFFIKKEIPGRGGKTYEKILAMPGKPIRELELNLRTKWRGSMFRRKKTNIADLLPPKMRSAIPMPVEMTDVLAARLKEVEADFRDVIQRAIGRPVEADNPSLATDVIDVFHGRAQSGIDFSEGARVRANLGRLKAPLAARFIIDELRSDNELDPEDRPKTVVFAHHKDVINIIAAQAKADLGDKAVVIYDGSVTSAKKREALVNRFQTDKKCRLFIMSLSGASGITLTASHRMRVVEPDWNPSNMAQIEDRIWRIGQEMPVNIGYLFIPDSFDINVGLKLVEKMETDARVVDAPSLRGMKSMVAKVDATKALVASTESCSGPMTAQSAFSFD